MDDGQVQNTQDAPVPMIDKDNTPVMVPMSRVSGQVAAGYRRGTFMTDPDGNTVVVPHEKLGEAFKRNYKAGPAEQQNIGKQEEQPGVGMRSLYALGRLAKLPYDATKAMYHAYSDPVTPEELQKKIAPVPESERSPVYSQSLKDYSDKNISEQVRKRGTYTGVMLDRLLMNPANEQIDQATRSKTKSEAYAHVAAAFVPGGPKAAEVGERIGKGDIAGGVIEGAGIAASPYLARKVIGKITGSSVEPLLPKEATGKLRQAFNPSPADAGYESGAKPGTGFMGQAEKHIDALVNKGHETGLPSKIANAKTPGEAMNHVAETGRAVAQDDPYYKARIEPYLNENFGNVQGYRGKTTGEGRNATLGQMNARLTEINDTLEPTYRKGGTGSASAEAAIGAEAKASLTAEAEAIRNKIAEEVSRRTGIPAETLKKERRPYGEKSDMADTMQYHANRTIEAENIQKNKPLTYGDILDPKGVVRSKKIHGTEYPQIKALRDVFENYEPKANKPLPQGQGAQTPPSRQQPAWMNQPIAPSQGAGGIPQHIQDAIGQHGNTPAIPAGQPGLLRPAAGPNPPASSPLPYGPEPALMRRPVNLTVGQEHPEIAPLSLGPKQAQTVSIPQQIQELVNNPKAGKLQVNSERAGKTVVAYKLGGETIGNASMTPFKDGMEMSTTKISDTFHGEPLRRKGHGTEMYEQAADYARSKGAKYLYSDDQVSPAAKGVWQKLITQGKAVYDSNIGRYKMSLK